MANGLKLFHVQADGFISGIDEFIVAQNKELAIDIMFKQYGGNGSGYSRKHFGAYEVTVDGYNIEVKEVE